MEPLDFMDPEPPIEIQKELSEPVCPDCGDTGIGLLGIHEWVEAHPNPEGVGEPLPVFMEKEEYGTPCPTCGREASVDDDLPEIECQFCGWQGDASELISWDSDDTPLEDRTFERCPRCESNNIDDYED